MPTLQQIGFAPRLTKLPPNKVGLLRVFPVPGEPTRFNCESGSLQCTDQEDHLFNRRLRPHLWVEGPCPGTYPVVNHTRVHVPCRGILQLRFHLVDLADFSGNGSCQCEWFMIQLRKSLEAFPARVQAQGRFRCPHIVAVREFALDLAVLCHERERYKDAKGQREEDQP